MRTCYRQPTEPFKRTTIKQLFFNAVLNEDTFLKLEPDLAYTHAEINMDGTQISDHDGKVKCINVVVRVDDSQTDAVESLQCAGFAIPAPSKNRVQLRGLIGDEVDRLTDLQVSEQLFDSLKAPA